MAIALAVACSKGITDSPEPTPPSRPQPPVTSTDSIVTVSFTTGGEVVLSEEPLTKSIATSPDDLWGFQVFQYPDSVKSSSDPSKGVAYVCGYYDCLDSIKIPLVKGKWYGFTLTYIPNGKNIIAVKDGIYGIPFNVSWHAIQGTKKPNIMYYNSSFDHLTDGLISKPDYGNDGISFKYKYFSSVERYQGVKWNVKATDSTTTIGINLYRMMTGVKIVAEDFTSGTLCVYGTTGTYGRGWSEEHKLEPAMDTIVTTRDTIMPDSTVVTLSDTIIQVAKESILDITVQTPSMPVVNRYASDALVGYVYGFGKKIMEEQPFYDEQEGYLQVVYKDTTGVEVSLYSNTQFEFKRLTKHVIKLNVADILNKETGFEPDIKDDPSTPMEEEDVNL